MWVILLGGVVAAAVLIRWRRSAWPFWVFMGMNVATLYARLWHRLTTNRLPPILPKGRAILIANHTCSADPALLTAACGRPLSFLIAREYCKIPVLYRVIKFVNCVPVTRDGRDVGAIRAMLRRLGANQEIGLFPEGGLSQAGRKRWRRAKGGAAYLALRNRAPVYPALILGGPQTNRLLRSWLLPSRTPVRIIFGPPVDLTRFYGRPIDRRLIEEVSDFLMASIASLRCQARQPRCYPTVF
jgi:1-acyl-sn-glycerol-3-phosphate acyltransferase